MNLGFDEKENKLERTALVVYSIPSSTVIVDLEVPFPHRKLVPVNAVLFGCVMYVTLVERVTSVLRILCTRMNSIKDSFTIRKNWCSTYSPMTMVQSANEGCHY